MFSGGVLTKAEFRRILWIGFFIAPLVLLTIAARLAFLSYTHNERASDFLLDGQLENALHSYQWSIRNYFPGNPFVKHALDETLNAINGYHTKGKISEERTTLQNLRASLLSIRSFYQPYPHILQLVDEKLSRLPSNENPSNP